MSVSAETAGVCLVNEVAAADTRGIQAGLNELWYLAQSGEGGGAVFLAASMTVIVPFEGEAEAERVTEVLDRVTVTHPLRAILLQSDEGVPEPRARLASHFRRVVDEPSRYWEEVRLVSPSRALSQTMSLVATLTVANLPIQTWWPGEPALDSDLYTQIADLSDRIVLDSSRLGDPVAALPTLAATIGVSFESLAFADLSWTRLTPWRVLTAEFFDDPADQQLLDSIERVAIEYVADVGGEAIQALLLVGWLASRLGWEPKGMLDAGVWSWQFDMLDGVRPIRVEILRRAGADGAPESRVPSSDGAASSSGGEAVPGLRAITLEAAERDRRGRYTVERQGNGEDGWTLAEVDGSRLEGHARLPSRGTVELLEEELGGFATDRIYHQALSVAASFFGR